MKRNFKMTAFFLLGGVILWNAATQWRAAQRERSWQKEQLLTNKAQLAQLSEALALERSRIELLIQNERAHLELLRTEVKETERALERSTQRMAELRKPPDSQEQAGLSAMSQTAEQPAEQLRLLREELARLKTIESEKSAAEKIKVTEKERQILEEDSKIARQIEETNLKIAHTTEEITALGVFFGDPARQKRLDELRESLQAVRKTLSELRIRREELTNELKTEKLAFETETEKRRQVLAAAESELLRDIQEAQNNISTGSGSKPVAPPNGLAELQREQIYQKQILENLAAKRATLQAEELRVSQFSS